MSLASAPATVINFVPGVTRQEPASRHDQVEDLVQARPGLATQPAGIWIKGQEMVHPRSSEQGAAVVETDVTVAAATAIRQHRAAQGIEGRRLGAPKEWEHLLLGPGVASP